MVQALLLLELRHTFETEAVNAAERARRQLPGARKVAVAFADLAGFTSARLGEALPPEELERVASLLVDLARDVPVAPVRFVKTIGDAVMLVCADPVPLLNAVSFTWSQSRQRKVCPDFGAVSPPEMPSAVPATGSAAPSMSQAVSPAQRVPARCLSPKVRARPSETREGFDWAFAGSRHLKGISGEVKLFRVSRFRE